MISYQINQNLESYLVDLKFIFYLHEKDQFIYISLLKVLYIFRV